MICCAKLRVVDSIIFFYFCFASAERPLSFCVDISPHCPPCTQCFLTGEIRENITMFVPCNLILQHSRFVFVNF